MKLVKDLDKSTSKKPEVSDKQAEEAFKTILTWIGENPDREGLLETPKRVVKAFKEYFKGYRQDASADLLKTFGDVGRHPLGRVFTISHYSLMKIDQHELSPLNINNSPSSYAAEAKWHDVQRIGELAFDHNKIFASCKAHLVQSVQNKPVGFELLPERFTLSQLQNLYEVILERKFDKRNFRKKINSMKLLIDTGKNQKSVSHRPAKLFQFDKEKYLKLKRSGYNFEI